MYFLKRNVLLNPGPATTTDTVKFAQIVPDICPREKEFADIMKWLRKELVKIVHGDHDKYTSVIFTGSGTIVMDICVNSLVPAGKKVLVVNNGAYSQRMVDICKYYHIPHHNLEYSNDSLPNLEDIDRVLRQDKDIAVVVAVHHETGTGILNPAREIGKIAHNYNCTFILDTIASYAMIPIDIEKDNIDFCMASAQKGLQGMSGVSFIVGRKDILEKSREYPTRSYYCNLYRQYDYFEKTGEMHFTPPVQTVYAAVQSVKEYWEEGEEAKWARHTRIWEAQHKGLAELGFQDVIKREWQSHLVISIKYPDDPNWSFEKVHDYCYERGFTIYPGKISGTNTFRLCSLGAIDVPDIEDFFVVLKDALIATGVKIPVKY